MSGQNPALVRKQREKMIVVRDTINNLVARHFPSARPSRSEEIPDAFGIDARPFNDLHSARYFAPIKGDEDMLPGFLDVGFNLTPADLTQDSELRSLRSAEADLLRDMNRLFTGKPEGDTFPVVYGKDEAGQPKGTMPHPLVMVAASAQYPQKGLGVIVYGTIDDLYERMQSSVVQHEDLRQFVPRTVRNTSV